jgi:hypothetical protein
MKPYSVDLREKIISVEEAGNTYGCSNLQEQQKVLRPVIRDAYTAASLTSLSPLQVLNITLQ